MTQYQQRTKKRFGQHFLRDIGVINAIVRAIHPKPEQQVVEIGPGAGALTYPLLQYLPQIDLVEIDRDVIAWWNKQSELKQRITLHAQDALTIQWQDLRRSTNLLRVVGNLPYNISTPLIFHLLEQANQVADMHFMLQKEVVDRIAATPNSKSYGRLSVMVQYYCEVESLFVVEPAAFHPPPKVHSAVVRLMPRPHLPAALDVQQLSTVVAQAFSQRRKTLRNTLKPLLSGEQLETLGIDPNRRAETLSVTEFIHLSNHLSIAAASEPKP